MNDSVLGQIALDFSMLSLLAVGGVVTVLPEMYRSVVEVHGWMSATQFAELFALAQAAPGPNMLVVSLIGWQAAGFTGALVATIAMCLPAGILTYAVAGLWHRFRDALWRIAIQEGLAPVTVGLTLASGYLITLSADHSAGAFAVTALTALGVTLTRIHPLWFIGGAGLLGLAGWV